MPPTSKSEQLGALVRDRRQERELSLRQLVDLAAERLPDDVSFDQAYLHRLEKGLYRKPHPAILKALSDLLNIKLADLYALAEYPLAKGAPNVDVYLRTATDLPEEAVAKVEQYIERLRREYGVEPKKRGRR